MSASRGATVLAEWHASITSVAPRAATSVTTASSRRASSSVRSRP
ncbi:hypothetical protein [Mycolicibacterium insubricum]|nr:hypothetical protein [Mycolicibacterium insubricum]